MVFESVFTIFNFVETLWILLPAYAANGLIPLFRGRHPIDSGRKFPDSRPILGTGKTWEGLAGASAIGIIIALIMMSAFPYLPWSASPIQLAIAPMSAALGFLLGFGAVIGDMAGSFIKRRINLERGRPAPILDQDDFVLGALLFAALLTSVKLEWILLALVMTPIIHLISSFLGYRLGLKREPW